MSNVENIFLSQDNLDLSFNIVTSKINQQTNQNLSSNNSVKKKFIKMANIVYNKVPPNNRSLQILNNILIDKSTVHFIELINKNEKLTTRNKYSNQNINNLEENNLNDRLKALEKSREINTIKQPVDFSNNKNDENNKNTNAQFNKLLKERGSLVNSNFKNEQESKLNLMSYDNSSINNLNMSDLTSNQYLDDNMTNINSSEYNTPIDNEIDPMILYERQNNQRKNDAENYLKQIENQTNFKNDLDVAQKQDEVNLEKINKKREETGRDFYKNLTYNTGNLKRPDEYIFKDAKFRDDSGSDFNLGPPAEQMMTNQITNMNPMYESVKQEMFKKKEFVKKTNYIAVSSLDRNWQNQSNENRYNFSVTFNSGDNYKQGVVINNQFKNILSAELVKAFIPYDITPVAGDIKFNLGVQSYPYLILNIPELGSVYSSSSNSGNAAFAHLIFDKEYKSTLMSNLSVNANIVDTALVTQYEKEYIRGNYGYIPVGFEKKEFFPSPLSSLNKMSISLKTNRGLNINNSKDSFLITSIETKEVDDANFWNTGITLNPRPTGQNNDIKDVIILTLNERYYHKCFKLGDTILINNLNLSKNADAATIVSQSDLDFLTNFLNREEGHIILGIEPFTTGFTGGAGADNEGLLNKLVIGIPGDISSLGTIINTHPRGKDFYDNLRTDQANNRAPQLVAQNSQTIFQAKIDELTLQIDNANNTNIPEARRLSNKALEMTLIDQRDQNQIELDNILDKISERISLINSSLQVSYIFKIITREEDVNSQMNVVNT